MLSNLIPGTSPSVCHQFDSIWRDVVCPPTVADNTAPRIYNEMVIFEPRTESLQRVISERARLAEPSTHPIHSRDGHEHLLGLSKDREIDDSHLVGLERLPGFLDDQFVETRLDLEQVRAGDVRDEVWQWLEQPGGVLEPPFGRHVRGPLGFAVQCAQLACSPPWMVV